MSQLFSSLHRLTTNLVFHYYWLLECIWLGSIHIAMYSIVFVLCGYVWPQSMSSLNFSLLFTLSTFGIVRYCILLSSYITLDQWPQSLSSLHYSLRCIWIPPGCIRLGSIASSCQLHQDRLWGCFTWNLQYKLSRTDCEGAYIKPTVQAMYHSSYNTSQTELIHYLDVLHLHSETLYSAH